MLCQIAIVIFYKDNNTNSDSDTSYIDTLPSWGNGKKDTKDAGNTGGTGNTGTVNLNSDGLPEGGKITGWTKHGTDQALGRDGGLGVSNDAIQDAVNNPTQVNPQAPKPGYGPTTEYVGKDATVILNQDGKVVTAWGTNSNGLR